MFARAVRRCGPLRCGPLLMGLLVSAIALPCAAQEPDGATTQRARELFAEGLELADAGDWERAVHRFRSALDLREAAPVRYNLATSLANMGRLSEALEELNLVLDDAEADETVRASATALRDELRPQLGGLVVEVAGDAEGTQVTVDGRPWEAIGSVAPADPGIRVVRLLRDMDELDVEEADVTSGEVARVILEMPGIAESDAGLTVEPGGDDAWIWGVVIGVVAVVAAGAVVTGVLLSEQGGGGTMGDFMPPVLEIGP